MAVARSHECAEGKDDTDRGGETGRRREGGGGEQGGGQEGGRRGEGDRRRQGGRVAGDRESRFARVGAGSGIVRVRGLRGRPRSRVARSPRYAGERRDGGRKTVDLSPFNAAVDVRRTRRGRRRTTREPGSGLRGGRASAAVPCARARADTSSSRRVTSSPRARASRARSWRRAGSRPTSRRRTPATDEAPRGEAREGGNHDHRCRRDDPPGVFEPERDRALVVVAASHSSRIRESRNTS